MISGKSIRHHCTRHDGRGKQSRRFPSADRFSILEMHQMNDLLDILVLLAAALLYLSMACSRYPQVS